MAKTTLKKDKIGKHTDLGFQTYYSAFVIRSVWYWHRDRLRDQWNKTESRNTPTYLQATDF